MKFRKLGPTAGFVSLILILGWSLAVAGQPLTEEFSVNGLKVLLKPNTANEIISAQLYLRGGAMNLVETTQGIEPLLFNSALKGSENYSKEKINSILDRTATQITTASSRDFTSVSLRCIKPYFDETWNVFADVIMHPTFPPDEVELVREQLLTGIQQRKDVPDVYLRDIVAGLFYSDHPYHLNPEGTEETMSHISIAQMEKHLKDNLVTSKLLLVVVGNVDKGDLKKKVESSLGKLKKGDYQPRYPSVVRHESPALQVVERELPTNYIIAYFSAPSRNQPDFYPMTIAISILRSRVWEEVRTKRNLSYAPSALYLDSFANAAGIYVTAVDPDTTIKVMFAELKRLQTEPVTVKDLKNRITMYLTRYYLNNETDDAQGQFLADFELSGAGWEKSDQYVENLRKVSSDDVQRVANQYFQNLQFAILGNPQLIDRGLFTSM